MSSPDLAPVTRRDGSPTLPRRGYSWPPFAEGNLAHVSHGTRSERLVSAKAEELHAALVERCPWVADLDAGAVARYCRVEARAVMLHDHLAAKPAEELEAVPGYLWTEANRTDALAAKLAQDLGLDPAGRARLAKDFGVAHHFGADQLAEQAAEGHRLRLEAEARLSDDAQEAGA